MPDWAKPSGYFGIGLQTVFKLCDEVVIKTRKKENPCYEIKVINNADNEFFDISIKELDDRRFEGTEIKSIFKSKNENFINYRGRRIENYEDPLLLEQKNDFYQNVMQMLTSDFKKSHIPLIINKTKLERRVDVENKEGNVFMSDYSLGADFSIKINMEDYIFANLTFKYKGVEFDTSFNVKCLVGELDIFKNSAGYWLTIDRKKGRTDRHKEIEEIITYILENHSSNLRENTKDDKLSDFYLYSVTGKSINYEWKQYEINGIKLEQYISGENDLFVYEHKYGFLYNTKFNDIDLNVMQILSGIFKKESLSLVVEEYYGDLPFDESESYDEDDGIGFIFKFKNDGLKTFTCPSALLRKEIELNVSEPPTRRLIPCYNEYYSDISICEGDIPLNINVGSSFNRWVDKFMFTPMISSPSSEFDLEQQLSLLLNFYISLNILSCTEDSFKAKYKECWLELGFIN